MATIHQDPACPIARKYKMLADKWAEASIMQDTNIESAIIITYEMLHKDIADRVETQMSLLENTVSLNRINAFNRIVKELCAPGDDEHDVWIRWITMSNENCGIISMLDLWTEAINAMSANPSPTKTAYTSEMLLNLLLKRIRNEDVKNALNFMKRDAKDQGIILSFPVIKEKIIDYVTANLSKYPIDASYIRSPFSPWTGRTRVPKRPFEESANMVTEGYHGDDTGHQVTYKRHHDTKRWPISSVKRVKIEKNKKKGKGGGMSQDDIREMTATIAHYVSQSILDKPPSYRGQPAWPPTRPLFKHGASPDTRVTQPVNSRGLPRNQAVTQGDITCYRCLEQGHRSNECTAVNANPMAKKCVKCNRFGHLQHECRSRANVAFQYVAKHSRILP
jgi:hypothetical protein